MFMLHIPDIFPRLFLFPSFVEQNNFYINDIFYILLKNLDRKMDLEKNFIRVKQLMKGND